MTSKPVMFVQSLAQQFLSAQLTARQFCDSVENFWNFGDWVKPFSDEDRSKIKALFDIVVWYSEFENDSYPSYKTKEEVAEAALRFLNSTGTNR